MKKFVEWGSIEFFPDVTESSIIAFDEWLDKKKMKPYSKWNNYHRFLNSFIIDAVREGLMTRNPYLHVRIKKEKSTGGIGKYLSPEEFQLVKAAELPTESLRRIRDLFVFQTYTCMAYKDLTAFKASKIVEVKGMKVYVGQRVKTGQTFTVPLLQEALDILEKYHNKLPIITNVKYNEYLKLVAQAAGIEKPISSHWARHTGATLLLNEGGFDMKIVAKILGHSTTRITEQVYAKLLDETVVDEMKKFEEKQKQKKENDENN
jgi:integrase